MKLKITVHGVAYEVEVEVLDPGEGFAPSSPLPQVNGARPPAAAPAAAQTAPAARAAAPPAAAAGGGRSVASPIAGTIVEVKCRVGDSVRQGDELLVIEAMKMNTAIAAPAAGTIKQVPVAAGDAVREGQVLVEFA